MAKVQDDAHLSLGGARTELIHSEFNSWADESLLRNWAPLGIYRKLVQ